MQQQWSKPTWHKAVKSFIQLGVSTVCGVVNSIRMFLLRSQACCQSHQQVSWLQGSTNTSKYSGRSCTPLDIGTVNVSDSVSACKPLCWGLSIMWQHRAGASGESCSTNRPLLNGTCSTVWGHCCVLKMCSRSARHRYSLCQRYITDLQRFRRGFRALACSSQRQHV